MGGFSLSTLFAVSLTAPSVALQDADCNGHYKSLESHVGYQPSAQTSEPCGVSSFSIHVLVEAEGRIVKIVGAEVEGAVTITISMPSECPSQKLWHTEDIHNCSSPLPGWHCNPQARQVPIKLYVSESPCPKAPSKEALTKMVIKALTGVALPGVSISVPCGKLDDVTGDLPETARYRWTAHAEKCSDKSLSEVETSAEIIFLDEGSHVLHGLFGEAVANPAQFDFEALVPVDEQVSGVAQVTGMDALSQLFAAGTHGESPEIVSAVLEAGSPIDWIDGLGASVETSFLYQEEWLERGSTWFGSFRESGAFDVIEQGVIQTPEGRSIARSHFYSSRGEGTIFTMAEGGRSCMVFPVANGAATLVHQGPLADIEPIIGWLDDPYGLIDGPAVNHEVTTASDTRVLIDQFLSVEYGEGVTSSLVSEALFGYGTRFTVDTSAEPVIVSSERYHVASGEIVQRARFSRFREVAPGVKRPMVIRTTEFEAGVPIRHQTVTLSGSRSEGQIPTELVLPRPEEDVWLVRLR